MSMTVKQIDDEMFRQLEVLERAHDRGDLTTEQFQEATKELAAWIVAQYAKLPQAQFLDFVMFGTKEPTLK
jgi:hypothetical protein